MANKVLSIITITVLCTVILAGCNKMKASQEAPKDKQSQDKYSIGQIEALKSAAEFRDVSFSEFEKDFDASLLRKTHQGCYVVLLLEGERKAFAFFNDEDILIRVLLSNGFMCKEEFQNQVVEQRTKSEMLDFDPNAILAPVSAIDITLHIVQEGVYVVKYLRIMDGEILEDPIVDSVKFIENASIPKSEDLFVRIEIPFIYEFDKKTGDGSVSSD